MLDPQHRDLVLQIYYKHVVNNKNLANAIYNQAQLNQERYKSEGFSGTPWLTEAEKA